MKKYPKKYSRAIKTLFSARSRCRSHPLYGGRGIKCLLTKDEIISLWIRDKAHLLKHPSIDRKDNDGNYEYGNCQFIEFGENTRKRFRQYKKKKLCVFCGEWFTAMHPRKSYCSKKCLLKSGRSNANQNYCF